nr:hypothetical protein B0A51_00420 [Rachicladosporium sp. CCFEE 5018]
MTLLICNKRHHTRFFPLPAQQRTAPEGAKIDARQNFKPGLLVDDVRIRNPYIFNFYLQSQSALQGTAGPMHYIVIHNGMTLTAAQLQQQTFALCWIYASSLTPISYAAPAYYADRMCERGRRYLLELLKPGHNSVFNDRSLLQNWNNGIFRPAGQGQGWEFQPAHMANKDLYAVDRVKSNTIIRLFQQDRANPVAPSL